MLGNGNADEVASAVVEDFFENKVYKVFVIEVESAVKGFGVVKLNEF